MNEKLEGKKVSAISLGCDKNRVDLEKMLFKIKTYGFEIVEDVFDADIVIVNTCAFISPAQQEAIDNILAVCQLKKENTIEKVVVTGCMAQRFKEELEKEIPEVDAYLSAKDNEKICEIIEDLYGVEHSKKSSAFGRIFTSQGSYAYLKIAEGCSNACSYCTIPRIKGRYTSYLMEKVVDEAKYLAKCGIQELVLVAQDVTRYGEDLYGKNCLIELCKKLSKIEGVEWIRLHYIYPEKLTDELLDFIENEKKICKYIDVPLQHIDNKILESMRRHLDEKQTRELVTKIKTKYPNIAVRTTFIVGYPDETGGDFKKLCDFLEESKFDYAGFFPFYREEHTPSFYMKHQHSKAIKLLRLKKAESLQNEIATEHAKNLIGKSFKTLIDFFDESRGIFVGHTEFLSPTVDFGVEIADNGNIEPNKFYEVTFVDFDGENYKGEIL